jgi:hypothetical protein
MKVKTQQPSQEFIRSKLKYEADAGLFTWVSPGNSSFVGMPAGHLDSGTGYVRIKLAPFGAFGAHRLAWIYCNGWYDDQKFSIDHIDGNRCNNALSNLRLATPSQNQMNSKPRSSTGIKGVGLLPSGSYRARIYPFGPGGGKIELGCFPTLEEAAEARMVASVKYFGEFSRG